MYWPYDFGGLYYNDNRPENAAEMSDALSRTILRKDAEGARRLFDHAFWEEISFTPDWFHLYAAVDQGDRDMVKLMVTFGARMNDAQLSVLCHAMPEKTQNLKHVLAEGGMRVDRAMATPVDAMVALQMDRRILSENLKHSTPEMDQEETFNAGVAELTLRAAMSGNAERAREIFKEHTQHTKGLDTTALITARIKDAPKGMSATDILYMLDALKDAQVPLQKLAIDKIPEQTGDYYSLIPALAERGLLGGDFGALREKVVRHMCFLQEEINLEDYKMRTPAQVVEQQRTLLAKVAAVICTADTDITPQQVRNFIGVHDANAGRSPEATRFMDITLVKSGFFNNPAFDAQSLKSLAATAPGDDLRSQFNRRAQKMEIDHHGLAHYLHRKRFDVLLNAINDGAWVPDAKQTDKIVHFINGQQPRRGVTDEAKAALRILKKAGADFSAVDPIALVGARHPLLAKEVVDMDLVPVKNISYYELQNKIPPHKGLEGLFAKPDDKHFALREFLYQVMYERDFPEHARAVRDVKHINYQHLYAKEAILSKASGLHSFIRRAARRHATGQSPYKNPHIYRPRGPKPGY